MEMKNLYRYFVIALLPAFIACSKGGSLALEHPLVKGPGITTGKPFFTTSLGGHSMVIEQGKTKTTGVHGWVGVNAVTQTRLDSSSGYKVYQDHAPPE